jgi:hypothetical protein
LSTDNTEANLVQLQEVRRVGAPKAQRDQVDVTHLLSPDQYKEFIGGLRDGGSFTAQFNYDPGSATDLALTDANTTGTNRKIRLEIPDTSGTGAIDWNQTFTGFVQDYGIDDVTPGEAITATATFKVAGAVEQGTGATGS